MTGGGGGLDCWWLSILPTYIAVDTSPSSCNMPRLYVCGRACVCPWAITSYRIVRGDVKSGSATSWSIMEGTIYKCFLLALSGLIENRDTKRPPSFVFITCEVSPRIIGFIWRKYIFHLYHSSTLKHYILLRFPPKEDWNADGIPYFSRLNYYVVTIHSFSYDTTLRFLNNMS